MTRHSIALRAAGETVITDAIKVAFGRLPPEQQTILKNYCSELMGIPELGILSALQVALATSPEFTKGLAKLDAELADVTTL